MPWRPRKTSPFSGVGGRIFTIVHDGPTFDDIPAFCRNPTYGLNFQVVSLVGLRGNSALARSKRLPPHENDSLFMCRHPDHARRAHRSGGLRHSHEQRQHLDSASNRMRLFQSGCYPPKPGRSLQATLQCSAGQQHVRALRLTGFPKASVVPEAGVEPARGFLPSGF